jgi:hypothetical protein
MGVTDVSVVPNPLVPSTSLEVSWAYGGGTDDPDAVSWNLFDMGGSQIQTGGKFSAPLVGPALFVGLQPNTTYYVQLCTYSSNEAGEDDGTSAWNMYSGTTAASAPPPPPPPPPPPTLLKLYIESITPYPNHLAKSGGEWNVVPNGATVKWAANEPAVVTYMEVDTPSGTRVEALNIGGSTPSSTGGTYTLESHTPGANYVLKLGAETGWDTPPVAYSSPVAFTAANNSNSLKAFLTASDVTGSNGIKQFFPPMTSISLRTYMGV